MLSIVHEVADILFKELELECLTLPSNILEKGRYSFIQEWDFFGVAEEIPAVKLPRVEDRLLALTRDVRIRLVSVNGPYRISFPQSPTFVIHLTLWPKRWLNYVCPLVRNAFLQAKVYRGASPKALADEANVTRQDLIDWHFGPRASIRILEERAYQAATWYNDGIAYLTGPIQRHPLHDPYVLAEYLRYSVRTALQASSAFRIGDLTTHFDTLMDPLISLTDRARDGSAPDVGEVELLVPGVLDALTMLVRRTGAEPPN